MNTRKPSRVTRKDVARAAGTSVAVISYVVNDGPRPVAAATKERVLAVIKELGYRPNSIAQGLARGESQAYGLIVPDISNPFFASMAHELEETVSAHNKVLILGDSAESKVREQDLVQQFLQRQLDGLFFVGVDSEPDLQGAVDAGMQVVMMDRVDPHSVVSSVAVDNVAAAEAATNHLIDHGYERIGLISGPPALSTAQDRKKGWALAMTAAGLPREPRWRIEAAFTRRAGLEAARTLFSAGQLPQAIFAANEQQAIGVLVAASERGIRVPEDLAIITFDGTDDSEFTIPAISTVVQPLGEMAKSALQLLTRPGRQEVIHRRSEFSLRLRGSCGHHRAGVAEPRPPAAAFQKLAMNMRKSLEEVKQ